MTVNGCSSTSNDKNGSLSMDTKAGTADLEKQIADLESRLRHAKSLLTSSQPSSPLSHNPNGMLSSVQHTPFFAIAALLGLDRLR